MPHYSFGICTDLNPETHSFVFHRKGEVVSEQFDANLFKEMMLHLSQLDGDYIVVLLQSDLWNVLEREMTEEKTGVPAQISFTEASAPKILMKIKRVGPKIEFHPANDWNQSFLHIADAMGIKSDLVSEHGVDDW